MERKHSELLNKDLAMNKAEYEALYKQHEALRNKSQMIHGIWVIISCQIVDG